MNNQPSNVSRRDALRFGALAAAGFAVAGSGLLSACGGGSSGGTPFGPETFSFGPPEESGAPRQGGVLTVGLITGGSSEVIDLRKANYPCDVVRAFALYDPLWKVAGEGKVKPGLATEWEPNATADEWSITLREGVVWHDGKPFTSADVLYTIRESWVSPENFFSAVLTNLIDLKKTRVEGPHKIVIALTRPLADFPSLPTIQNCGIIQDGFKDFSKPIGTGPFKFKSFTPGSRSEFVAHKDYWGDGPYVDSFIVDSSYDSDDTRLNALLAGNIDVLPQLPPARATSLARGGKVNVGNAPGPGFTSAICRYDLAPFNNLELRKALKLSFDRKRAVDVLYSGYAAVTGDLVGYKNQGFAEDLKPTYDPDQAKAIIKKAGLGKVKVKLDTAALTDQTNSMATLFKEHASKAGITVDVNRMPAANYFTPAAGYMTRPFSMETWTNCTSSLTQFYLAAVVSGSAYDVAFWGKGAGHDAQIFDALGELDPTRSTEKWHEVQKKVHEEGPFINSISYNWLDGYGKKVRGVKTTTAGLCDNFDFAGAWLAE